jgi:hypothetical protein
MLLLNGHGLWVRIAQTLKFFRPSTLNLTLLTRIFFGNSRDKDERTKKWSNEFLQDLPSSVPQATVRPNMILSRRRPFFSSFSPTTFAPHYLCLSPLRWGF